MITLPPIGTVIRGTGIVEFRNPAKPILVTHAFKQTLFGTDLGWGLARHGITCILMPRAASSLIRTGIKKEYPITGIKVLRHSTSGKSLLVEIV